MTLDHYIDGGTRHEKKEPVDPPAIGSQHLHNNNNNATRNREFLRSRHPPIDPSPIPKWPVKQEFGEPQFCNITSATNSTGIEDKANTKQIPKQEEQQTDEDPLHHRSKGARSKKVNFGHEHHQVVSGHKSATSSLTDSTLGGIVIVGAAQPPTDATRSHLVRTQDVEVYVRPARKNSKTYANFIPAKLFYKPFKYDMLVLARMDLARSCTLSIEACDAETLIPVVPKTSPSPSTPPATVASSISVERARVARSLDRETCEINFRIQFNVCSFLCHKKAFVMRIRIQSSPDSKSEIESFDYFTEQFSTFARKTNKEHDIWDLISKGEITTSTIGGNVIDQSSCLHLNDLRKARRPPQILKRVLPPAPPNSLSVNVKLDDEMPPPPPRSASNIKQHRHTIRPHKRQRIGYSQTSTDRSDSDSSHCTAENDGEAEPVTPEEQTGDVIRFSPIPQMTGDFESEEEDQSDYSKKSSPALPSLPPLKLVPRTEPLVSIPQIQIPVKWSSGSCALEAMMMKAPHSPSFSKSPQLCDFDPISSSFESLVLCPPCGGGGDRELDCFSPMARFVNSPSDPPFDFNSLLADNF